MGKIVALADDEVLEGVFGIEKGTRTRPDPVDAVRFALGRRAGRWSLFGRMNRSSRSVEEELAQDG